MATFEKRTDASGATSYRVKIRLRGHQKETATFKRKTDAKRWATDTEAAIRAGRYFKTAESKKRTLSDAIQKYRKEVLPSLKDISHREQHLTWWENDIGHTILADLQTALISESREKIKNTPSEFGKHKGKLRSEATVNRYLASLSPVLTSAVKEWDWLDSNPCEKVKRGRESRGRVRYLSEEERNAILSACDNQADYPELITIVLIAICTGARRGEIMSLRWRHVDLVRRRLLLEETKNGESRSVPLAGPALETIKDWAKVRSIDKNSLVFPGHSEKSKNKPLNFDKAWQKAIHESSIEDFRFHDLRHTAASYLAMNGAGLREIGDILGHKTLAMVQRYSHLCDDHKQATMERMTTAIFGGGNDETVSL